MNCFFPGNIATDAMDTWKLLLGTPFGWAFKKFFAVVGQRVTDAAATALFLAASKKISTGEGVRGKYFVPIATECGTSGVAEDMHLARSLWEWTDEKVEETLGVWWKGEGVGI